MQSNTISGRSPGIDLYKALSMLMVLFLHVLGPGGVLEGLPFGSLRYYSAWFLELLAYCAVNCFALATGYLMVGRRFRYRKLFILWLIVNFYNLVFMLVDIFVLGQPTNINKLMLFFPASTRAFWYFTAYFCLFFFIPFLNKLIEVLPKRSYIVLLLTGFALFSLLEVVLPSAFDPFHLRMGYSAWWLMYLYLLGAGIKKYGFLCKCSAWGALAGYLSMAALTLAIKTLCLKAIASGSGLAYTVASHYGSERFVSYVSPTVLASAVFLMLLCMKLPIPRLFHKPLAKIQPLVFQVYIIHQHYVVWATLISGRFGHYAEYRSPGMLLRVVGTVLLIYLLCLAADYIRSLIFRLLRIEKLVDKLSDAIYAPASKLLDRLSGPDTQE